MHAFTDPADDETYVSALSAWTSRRRSSPASTSPTSRPRCPSPSRPRRSGRWSPTAETQRATASGTSPRRRRSRRTSSWCVPARGTPAPGSTPGSRSAGTSGARWPTELDRDFDDMRQVTEASFDFYTDAFDEPYPFDSYDQVMRPGHNWGALETPGCVTFRDEYVPRTSPTPTASDRATVIAHEMAHMWFGDLVTMKWWQDTWLNESFADFMGYTWPRRPPASSARGPGFSLTASPPGTPPTSGARPTRSPRPEHVVDVDTALQQHRHDHLRQGHRRAPPAGHLAGRDTFVAGHERATSTRTASATPSSPTTWRRSTPSPTATSAGWAEPGCGRPASTRSRVRREDDVPVLEREGSRPHRTQVTAYDVRDGRLAVAGQEQVDLADAAGAAGARRTGLLPNSSDETFAGCARTRSRGRRCWRGSGPSPTRRHAPWSGRPASTSSAKRCSPPMSLVDAALEQLPGEPLPSIWEPVVDRLLTLTLPRHVDPADLVDDAGGRWPGSPTGRRTSGLALATRRLVVACTADVDRLPRCWRTTRTRTWPGAILVRLAELGAVDAGPDRARGGRPAVRAGAHRRRPRPGRPARRPRRRSAPGPCFSPTTSTTGSSTRSASGSGRRSR